MLNATLTVRAHQAGSHQKKGWETFTDQVVRLLNDSENHLVFILWGAYAQRKGEFIDTKKHFHSLKNLMILELILVLLKVALI